MNSKEEKDSRMEEAMAKDLVASRRDFLKLAASLGFGGLAIGPPGKLANTCLRTGGPQPTGEIPR